MILRSKTDPPEPINYLSHRLLAKPFGVVPRLRDEDGSTIRYQLTQ